MTDTPFGWDSGAWFSIFLLTAYLVVSIYFFWNPHCHDCPRKEGKK